MPRLDFEAFGVDLHTGFLTPEPPLRRLLGEHEAWEILLDDAKANFVFTGPSGDATLKERAFGCMWRKRVRKMEVLSCVELYGDVQKLQRAHHTLSFLNQFYIHSLPARDPSKTSPSDPIVIPRQIAIPFIDVSRRLGIAPIVTYADTVLWNWDIIDPSLPLSRTNIRIRDLFTGSAQEEHFFLTSARIEIEGWNSLDAMRRAIAESGKRNPNVDLVAHHLRRLARSLDIVTQILFAVRDNLDPDFFYNRFRPWIQGADQGVESPSWLYEGVDGEGLILQPSGPSAGQSALMHAYDVFLNVPHPHGKRGLGGGCTRFNAALDPHNPLIEQADRSLPKDHPPVPGMQAQFQYPMTPPMTPPATPTLSSSDTAIKEFPILPFQQGIDTSFNNRMRSYIPQNHQDFLLELSRFSIRSFVESYPMRSFGEGDESLDAAALMRQAENVKLAAAYDDAVMAMKRWRDAHIVIVTQYVIVPARAVGGANEPGRRVTVDETGTVQEREAKPVRGTGGTSLVPLLKIYRNNTLDRTVLSKQVTAHNLSAH